MLAAISKLFRFPDIQIGNFMPVYEYEHEKDKTNMKIKLTNTIENLNARQCLSILFYHSDRWSDLYYQHKLIEDDKY